MATIRHIDGTNRREFLAAGLAAAVMSRLPASALSSAQRTHRYIDIHTHLGAFYPGRELTAELLVEFMDEHDVEKSCVWPIISPEAAPRSHSP